LWSRQQLLLRVDRRVVSLQQQVVQQGLALATTQTLAGLVEQVQGRVQWWCTSTPRQQQCQHKQQQPCSWHAWSHSRGETPQTSMQLCLWR
jgi:hypothetical protein